MSKIFDYAVTQAPDEVKRFIDNSIEIANQIHFILERQGKTQRDLANLLGKKESEISKWLRGSHNFTLKSLSKIESVLNEKIITSREQFQDMQSDNYSPVIKNDFPTDFVEVKIDKKGSGDPNTEESLYAIAA